MAKNIHKMPAEFIVPLDINGLRGRMLRVPAPAGKKREILFVYGHHSSLERWWGLVEDLNQYGAVTMPDLPGFGGMESFYKIGEKPTLDNLADYLAAFIKLRYNRKRVTIAGLSFGFAIATRMLQRYPELVKKVDMVISIVGLTHKDDFTFSRSRFMFYKSAATLFSHSVPAFIFKSVGLNSVVLRAVYSRTHNAKDKFNGTSKEQYKELMDFEIVLWKINDVKTWCFTTLEMFSLDNCRKQIDLPIWHIRVKGDRYFDNHRVEQHLQVVFNHLEVAVANLNNHAPSIIADKKAAAPIIPKKIRKALAS